MQPCGYDLPSHVVAMRPPDGKPKRLETTIAAREWDAVRRLLSAMNEGRPTKLTIGHYVEHCVKRCMAVDCKELGIEYTGDRRFRERAIKGDGSDKATIVA